MNTTPQDSANNNDTQSHAAQPLTPAEALELLQSAVSYCQSAGLKIHAGNMPNLVLSIKGAVMTGEPPSFMLSDTVDISTPTPTVGSATRPVRSRL